MISKDELNKFANKSGLSLYQQEKEYLLKLFLNFYYKKHDDAIFKGGTCLKFLLGLNRFSEDLDFNVNKPSEFRKQIKAILNAISDSGINNYFLKDELFEDSYTCEIGFEGPLFNGTKQTQNKFRIDAGYHTGTFEKPKWKLIKSEYPETEQNIPVLTMAMEEIMAEKILVMFKRNKGRDLYDIWFLLNAGIKPNNKLLKKKLKKESVCIDFKNIISKRDYERDMSRLTNRMIPYQQVMQEVMKSLEKTL